MNLLDRYLQAVRFFLPRRQQDDIVRELSENLLSQMEDRAEALGRPLTEDEQADILRRHGHPMLVAGPLSITSAADRSHLLPDLRGRTSGGIGGRPARDHHRRDDHIDCSW